MGKQEWERMQESLSRVRLELQSEEEKLQTYRIKAQEHEALKQQVWAQKPEPISVLWSNVKVIYNTHYFNVPKKRPLPI